MSAAAPKYHMDAVFDPARAHPGEAHAVLMSLIPPRSRVLELGCASGYLSGYMEQALGCRVTGLDLDLAAVAIAAGRCSEAYAADLDAPEALRVATGSAPYDVLLAAAVLEHLKDPERVLREAGALLRPGARVIVSLPNVAYWSIRLRLLLGRFDYGDYGVLDRTHLRLYTLRSGRALLEGQGYGVRAVYAAGSVVQNMAAAFRRGRGGGPAPAILPGLFGYELIYDAAKA